MIVDEDDHFLILNKPPGWSIYPQGSSPRPAITSWLKSHFYSDTPIRPVHRLDVETSGLLICGKHQEVIRDLNTLFRTRSIQKRYWAICKQRQAPHLHFSPHALTHHITIPLGFDPTSQVRIKMGRGTRSALTTIYLKARSPQKDLVWLEVSPQTGRQHQIRVHLSLVGYPIVGDKLYGEDERFFLKAHQGFLDSSDFQILGFPRHLLHASRLEFTWKKKKYEWTCSWPLDIVEHFSWLA